MSGWSSWLGSPVTEKVRDKYRWPGVYKMRLVDKREHPIEIERFLGKDKDGILAVGESKNVTKRIRDFYRAFEGQQFKHSEGNTLFLVRMLTNFMKGTYVDSKIQFSARKLSDKAEAVKEEEILLKNYFIQYGELPPLNRNLPDKRSWLEDFAIES